MCPQEKAGHTEWSIRLSPTNKVSTDNAETMSAMVKLAGKIDFAEANVWKYLPLERSGSAVAAAPRRAWRAGPSCGHAS